MVVIITIIIVIIESTTLTEFFKAFFKSMISFNSYYHPFRYYYYPRFTSKETDVQGKEQTLAKVIFGSAEVPI